MKLDQLNWTTLKPQSECDLIPSNHLQKPASPQRERQQWIVWVWEYYMKLNNLYNFCFLSLSTILCFLFTSYGFDTFNSMSISWSLHYLQGSSLMLPVLLSWMLRPVGMGSQDSVQELLRDRLAPSLLRGDFCCVNQCLPFVLHKSEKHISFQKSEASNKHMILQWRPKQPM